MDWEQFQLWHNYVLNTEYKDNLIDRVIGEFSRVLTNQKNRFSNFDQNKEDLTKNDWKILLDNKIFNKLIYPTTLGDVLDYIEEFKLNINNLDLIHLNYVFRMIPICDYFFHNQLVSIILVF